MNRKAVLIGFLVLLFIIVIYRPWFMGSEIIGGDWSYRFSEMVRDMSRAPASWQDGYGGGWEDYHRHFFEYL